MYLSLKYQLKTWLYAWGKRGKKERQATEKEAVFDRDGVHQKVSELIGQSHQTAKAVVITPTTGSRCSEKAIQSVCQQSDENTRHLVVIDGAEFWEASQKIIQQFDNDKLDVLLLPHNTGKNGMNGHRNICRIVVFGQFGLCFLFRPRQLVRTQPRQFDGRVDGKTEFRLGFCHAQHLYRKWRVCNSRQL